MFKQTHCSSHGWIPISPRIIIGCLDKNLSKNQIFVSSIFNYIAFTRSFLTMYCPKYERFEPNNVKKLSHNVRHEALPRFLRDLNADSWIQSAKYF